MMSMFRHSSARAVAALAAVTALVLVGLAAPVVAQDPSIIAEVLVENGGLAIEPGADVDDARAADLAASAREDGIGLVVLSDDIADGPDAFADQLVEEVSALDSSFHTIVVVTPRGMGASSSEFVPVDVNEAVRAGNRSSDPVDALAGFVTSITGTAVEVDTAPAGGGTRVPLGDRETTASVPPTPSSDRSSSSSSSGGISIWPIIGVGVLGFLAFSWWGKRKTAKQQEENLEKARDEAKSQLSAIAQFVYDLNDRISLGDDDGLKTEFATASGDYQQLSELVGNVETGPEMAELSDKVDNLRWKMEAFEARLEGREPPPRPQTPRTQADHQQDHDRIPVSRDRNRNRRTACFFDPQHRPGVVPATVEMDRESVDVLLCRDCSRRLRDGQQPETRQVNVGRRKVPAALAPLGYGGLGLLLASLFRVRTNDMTQGVSFDWSNHVSAMPKPGTRPRAERLPTRPRRRRGGHQR